MCRDASGENERLPEAGATCELLRWNDSENNNTSWTLAGKTYQSRLIVGTGKYKDFEETAKAVEASGAEIVTVAVRRVNVSDPNAPMLVDYVDPKKITYLPNCVTLSTGNLSVR